MTLSLAMIVRDEERTLGRVLADAATFCDELVVVDTGSVDATRDIAARAGAKVVDFPWVDHFAKARNASFDACTSDWIVWLDADDTVSPAVQSQLRGLKSDLDDRYDAMWMTYRYHFDSNGQCTRSFPRERLLRRAAGLRWVGAVHEVIAVPAGRSLERLDLYVDHRPYEGKDEVREGRNLRILEREYAAGDRSTRTLFYYGNELLDANRYEEALAAYISYLEAADLDWERHQARMKMAQCADALGRTEESVAHLHAALREDPARANAFVALGRRYFQLQQWSRALPWFAAAAALTPPTTGFVDPPDYSWLPLDHLGVCLINLGRYEDGIGASLQALAAGHPYAERLRDNIKWAVEQIP